MMRQAIARAMESIYKHARIDAENKGLSYFAVCEVLTIWYTVEAPNTLYGFPCKWKLKCKSYSPKDGTELFPYFDDSDDLVALSFRYQKRVLNQMRTFFETYTADRHFKWMMADEGWEEKVNEEIKIGKIPGVYVAREEPIYKDLSEIREDVEYTISRNSDVIAYNAAPLLKIIGNLIGREDKGESQRVYRMEQGGDMAYVAWEQAIQALSYQVKTETDLYWSQAQMPDISFQNMKDFGNIGYDARQTLFMDAHLKIGDEEGTWVEVLERESNIVKAFLKQMKVEWALKAYTGTTKAGDEYSRYFQTDPDALKAFQQRKAGGMNLSQRVWNLSEQYKTELEMALSAAIEPGTSAMELAADIKTYLNEPDKMFRRFRYKDEEGNWQRKWKQKVTDADGKVHFIDADPKAYHPGRGVYRSSARNAQRLARTEINMAYRKAEQERWKSFDFVVGYEVKITQNGKHVEDICDCLKGKYRKDFKFMGWHPQCYKDDMDVLTKAGWKRFKDVSDDDLIMSLNPDSRKTEWVSVVARQCYDFDGELVRFYNKSLDCAVTPDHRMVYLNKGNGQIKYCQASEFRFTKGAFYRGAEYTAKDKEWFEIEGKKIRFDDYCAFMGYYLSDGCLQHDTGIVISQQAGCFAFYDIVDIVAKMGYDVTFTHDVINIYNAALNRHLSQFSVCNKKFIPDEIKTASKRQIQIFLDAFIKCDGHARKCKSFIGNHGNAFHSDKEERMYFTTSERLAGDLSELILKVGHRPSFEFQEPKTSIRKDGTLIKSNHICYRIRECYSTTATVFKKEYLPYSGKVYDLTLDRNHIMYVRRNGKCFWGSNCMCYTIPILKTEDEFFDDDEDAKSVNEVEDVPQGFKDWVKDNEERIDKVAERGKLPYFIADNKRVVENILEGGSGSDGNHTEEADATRIEANRREYERLKSDPNYTDVKFNPQNGGLKATHVEHNFDGDKGWYEQHVQTTGYKNGHSIILEKEIHTIKNKRNVEGLFDNQPFEIAGAETGIANNIRNALKHCASKPGCKVAVVFFPDENIVDMANIRDGLKKYFGLKGNPNQFNDFDHIYFMTSNRIIYHQKKTRRLKISLPWNVRG